MLRRATTGQAARHVEARASPACQGASLAQVCAPLLNDQAWRRPDGTLVTVHRPRRKIFAYMNQTVVFLPMLIVLGAFMFFASRRQKRAMQATIDLHDSPTVGDRAPTT